MTAVLVEAPDQFSRYAVTALLEPYPDIRVLPDDQASLADVRVIVTPTLAALAHRHLPEPHVLIVERVGPQQNLPANLLRRSDVTPGLLAARIQEAARDATATPAWAPTAALDEPERAILRLLAQGLEVPEIALRLGVSEAGVRVALHRMMTRLQLTNRWQVVAYAFRTNLI